MSFHYAEWALSRSGSVILSHILIHKIMHCWLWCICYTTNSWFIYRCENSHLLLRVIKLSLHNFYVSLRVKIININQIRPLGTVLPVRSTQCGRNYRRSERIINRVLFRAGPKDRIILGDSREPSFLFQRISVTAQQLSQRWRRVTTPASVFLPFAFNP